MLSFECDYTLGAHPQILRRLEETNFVPQPGYGEDEYTKNARRYIAAAAEVSAENVWLISGGTQTNKIVISAILRNYDGVIAAQTGHIAVHEAGAIENSGHKVITLPAHGGKLCPRELEAYMSAFNSDGTRAHMVQPAMVYISQPTEYGTVYSKSELEDLYGVCRRFGLYLFVDGARLGYALEGGFDGTLGDISACCDCFYIGGTKVGCLCGEAVVFTKESPPHFFTTVKQNGGLLAKGRLLGVQFETLFEDGLYFELSRNAIEKADLLRRLFRSRGFEFLLETTTNQIFVIMENAFADRLSQYIRFGVWEPYDGCSTVFRFATDWATTPENAAELEAALKKAKN